MATLIAVGRLGSNATVKELDGGKKITKFSVACDQGWGDKKATLWVNCAMFGDRGEKVAPYLVKGTTVEVIGTPTVRAYDKDGPQSSLECNVMEVKLHGRGKSDDKPKEKADDDHIPF